MAPPLSYPHPVLGNRDDIAVGLIDPDVTFKVTEEAVELTIDKLITGNPTLDGMLASGSATWSIRPQCARTYFRTEFASPGPGWKRVFDGHDLEGRVQLEVMLIVAEKAADYRPDGIHPDYGPAKFDLDAGEILGVGPSFTFDVDKKFDPLRAPVTSIMRVSKGEFEEGPFRVELGQDVIELLLSPEDWKSYAGVKEKLPGVLHAALVLPALVEAIRQLAQHDGRRWADRLKAMIETRNIDTGSFIEAAQVLLQGPLARAFNEINRELERDI